jgi:hypothetical protein
LRRVARPGEREVKVGVYSGGVMVIAEEERLINEVMMHGWEYVIPKLIDVVEECLAMWFGRRRGRHSRRIIYLYRVSALRS